MFSSIFVGAWPTAPFRQTLTSVSRNIHLDTWQITSRDFEFKSATPWSVQKYMLRGGKQEGVAVIMVNNGTSSFVGTPTRGMSGSKVEMADIRTSRDARVKE